MRDRARWRQQARERQPAAIEEMEQIAARLARFQHAQDRRADHRQHEDSEIADPRHEGKHTKAHQHHGPVLIFQAKHQNRFIDIAITRPRHRSVHQCRVSGAVASCNPASTDQGQCPVCSIPASVFLHPHREQSHLRQRLVHRGAVERGPAALVLTARPVVSPRWRRRSCGCRWRRPSPARAAAPHPRPSCRAPYPRPTRAAYYRD